MCEDGGVNDRGALVWVRDFAGVLNFKEDVMRFALMAHNWSCAALLASLSIVGCRLVPDDYLQNTTPFDAVFLPEAWYFMQDKWVSDRPQGVGPWPLPRP